MDKIHYSQESAYLQSADVLIKVSPTLCLVNLQLKFAIVCVCRYLRPMRDGHVNIQKQEFLGSVNPSDSCSQ